MYEKLVKRLRDCATDTVEGCTGCPYQGGRKWAYCMNGLITEAAIALEELNRSVESWEKIATRAVESLEEMRGKTTKEEEE